MMKKRRGIRQEGEREVDGDTVRQGRRRDPHEERRRQRYSNPASVSRRSGRLGFWRLFTFFASLRVVGALVLRTYYNPDEYWQGPEVAHWLIFGTGHLTWEWLTQLRSFVHPLLLSLPYIPALVLDVTNSHALHVLPRVLQALLSAVGEACICLLAQRDFGSQCARWTLIFQALSWYHFYTMPRTFSNTAEAALTAVGLLFWPDGKSRSGGKSWRDKLGWPLAALFATLSFMIRPTSAVTWSYMGLYALRRLPWKDFRMFALGNVLLLGAAGVSVSVVVDRVFYGTWTLVPLNFFLFNFVNGRSEQYGGHNLTFFPLVIIMLGIPVVLALPGALHSWKTHRRYLGLVLWSIIILSIPAHKEHRFLLPLLPLVHIYAGVGALLVERMLQKRPCSIDFWFARLLLSFARVVATELQSCLGRRKSGRTLLTPGAEGSDRKARMEEEAEAADSGQEGGEGSTPVITTTEQDEEGVLEQGELVGGEGSSDRVTHDSSMVQESRPDPGSEHLIPTSHKELRYFAILIAMVHMIPTLILAFIHQGGTIAATHLVADLVRQHNAQSMTPPVVHFLLPCHSSPYYSLVHESAVLIQPDCSPPVFHQYYRPRHLAACQASQLPSLLTGRDWCHGPILLHNMSLRFTHAADSLSCVAATGTYSAPRLPLDVMEESEWLMKRPEEFLAVVYSNSAQSSQPRDWPLTGSDEYFTNTRVDHENSGEDREREDVGRGRRQEPCPWPGKWMQKPDIVVVAGSIEAEAMSHPWLSSLRLVEKLFHTFVAGDRHNDFNFYSSVSVYIRTGTAT